MREETAVVPRTTLGEDVIVEQDCADEDVIVEQEPDDLDCTPTSHINFLRHGHTPLSTNDACERLVVFTYPTYECSDELGRQ